MTVQRTRVKFCGLVRPQDVDTAVALGVDAVGLVFYPKSARCVTLDEAAVLRRRLPSWVRAVGLFVNEPLDVMREGVRRVGLDVVQAHGDETPQALAGLGGQGGRYWKALRIGGQVADEERTAWLQAGRVPADARALDEALGLFGQAECCLLDSAGPGFGGTGHAFDWSLLEGRSQAGSPRDNAPRLVLAGGLRPETVGEAIRQVGPFAVDVSSGIQGDDPRKKDTVRMERFMTAVLQADADRAQAG